MVLIIEAIDFHLKIQIFSRKNCKFCCFFNEFNENSLKLAILICFLMHSFIKLIFFRYLFVFSLFSSPNAKSCFRGARIRIDNEKISFMKECIKKQIKIASFSEFSWNSLK